MIARLLERALSNVTKSILLLGPRQTGKSTLLRQLEPDLVINLADETTYLRHLTDTSLLGTQVGTMHRKILVDEVQRIPALLNTIQAIMDEKGSKKIRFLLSGSSARKLRRGNANLLPGRVLGYSLGGLCPQELDYNVDLQRAMTIGFLPEPYLEDDTFTAQKLLQTYASTYLKEEIQAEALSKNIHGFARFLQVMAENSGRVIDFSKLSTKSKVSRSSAVRFVELLEDTLIGRRIHSFNESQADVIAHPKFYFFDPGVLNGLLVDFHPSHERLGNLFEHVIFAMLANSAYALDEKINIEFFRTRHGVEIDFIVRWRNKIWAIEVKVGHIHSRDLSHLAQFRTYCPQARCLAVSVSEALRQLDGITICNPVEMLRILGM